MSYISEFNEVRASKNAFDPWSPVCIFIRNVSDVEGVRRIAWPINTLEFKIEDEHSPAIEHSPVIGIGPTSAQLLMDDLWRCGLRPSEGAGSAGAFHAQGRHLDDMRAIVARNIGVSLEA